MKRILFILLPFFGLLFLVILTCNFIIEFQTKSRIYSELTELPSNRVGLLLGTSKYAARNTINLYYKYRLDAAKELYEKGKIEYILVSGDNGSKQYNEPTTIKKDLQARGIPGDKIYLDYAGFRTYDSMIRSKKVFGLAKFTVISQKFHNQRAIYIGHHMGIDAIGFNAKDVPAEYGKRTRFREYFARVKVFLDIIFDKKPRYLGKQILIG